jgi:branched-chain amino acid transport system permease protein
MATLAMGLIMNIVFSQLTSITGGHDGIAGVPYLSIGGFTFNSDFRYYYLVWIICLAVLLISQNIVSSRTGRALRAIRDNEQAAESVGINILQMKAKVFALSAVYASIAGSLLVHYWAAVSPAPFGFSFSIRMLVMAVVGGLASVWGAIFGTGAVHLLGDWLQNFGDYETIAFGAALLLIMIFMPKGLWVHLKIFVQRLIQRRQAQKSKPGIKKASE